MHSVGRRFPLVEAAATHEALESGRVMGKVVVDIN
ncbi:MAG: zinc-binding dehydrogenase [Kiloniellales bacterium]